MVRGVDFLRLYQEFGLGPDADFEQLKLAYRRRVSVLHPDRMDAGDAISQDLANQHLQRLTTLYEAAARFHRQHGRLPGAVPTARSGASGAGAPAHARRTTDAVNAARVTIDSTPAPAPRRRRAWLAALAIIGALALTAWFGVALDETDHVGTTAPDPVAPMPTTSAARRPSAAPAEGIRLGMSEREVARILGEPVTRDATRWDYGPSWVRFDDGVVESWYSSPLRRLRIANTPPATRPAPDAPEPSNR